jgi:hypothetical protein
MWLVKSTDRCRQLVCLTACLNIQYQGWEGLVVIL